MDKEMDDAAFSRSCDSPLYGDADTVSALQERIRAFDVEEWISQHRENPAWPQKQPSFTEMASHLHNPYAGVSYAWQLTEPLDEFLSRLPPATTDQTPGLPWIFICNPFIPRVPKDRSASQFNAGNEDEGPEQEGASLPILIEGGMERLELLNTFTQKVSSFGKPLSTVEKETQKEKAHASLDILQLAHAARIRAGKWMIFCPASEVNALWETVAKATANNELGIAAKVLPRPQDQDPRKDRLICVYTADFMDKPDVGRVLRRLRELRLVEARSRRIYYKPGWFPSDVRKHETVNKKLILATDAYTYLGIASGNKWGLKSSIYNSADAFGT